VRGCSEGATQRNVLLENVRRGRNIRAGHQGDTHATGKEVIKVTMRTGGLRMVTLMTSLPVACVSPWVPGSDIAAAEVACVFSAHDGNGCAAKPQARTIILAFLCTILY
jgi:hypothetical protein